MTNHGDTEAQRSSLGSPTAGWCAVAGLSLLIVIASGGLFVVNLVNQAIPAEGSSSPWIGNGILAVAFFMEAAAAFQARGPKGRWWFFAGLVPFVLGSVYVSYSLVKSN